ncbi:Lrp/AsnC family transcriptional regulator [Marinovum sp.]|uniref:Lrp/AsnC family transcriptional regulator n=1 Tax=Marinovum sp. TaxID=2024839 RepID=UPI003A943AB4
MDSLDAFDLKILAALQKDATQSMDALAETAGLSRNACWRRMRNLEERGVIRKRVALLDPVRAGCPLQAFVMVRTNAHDADWMEKFDRAVRVLPEIIGAHRMTGDLDYVLRVRVADVPAYDAFYKKLIAMVPVSDISASFVMEDIKDTTEIPL